MQLDFLARHDPTLEPHFYGTVPCNKLPRHPQKDRSVGYIVNTDPHDQPGRHWIEPWKTCVKFLIVMRYHYKCMKPLSR